MASPAGTSDRSEPAARFTERIKELLTDTTKRIALEDTIDRELRTALAALDRTQFPMNQQPVDATTVRDRLSRFAVATEHLSLTATLLARWGEAPQLPTLRKILARLADREMPTGGSMYAWLSIDWYPVTVVMYGAGIAALSADRYDSLRELFEARISGGETARERVQVFARAIADSAEGAGHVDAFKLLPEYKEKIVPQSEYLFAELRSQLDELLFLGRSYESLFDRFEVLQALSFAATRPPDRRVWGPLGRFSWKWRPESDYGPLGEVEGEAGAAGQSWPPLRAGLFGGSLEGFQFAAKRYREEALRRPF